MPLQRRLRAGLRFALADDTAEVDVRPGKLRREFDLLRLKAAGLVPPTGRREG